jgi:glycine/D-amino acid oxidase-like deaminating enzyme/nitrite reductase/ring-hydroxylating ferredoxin subunit
MGILWKENGIFKEEGIERSESLWIQNQYRNNEGGEGNSNSETLRPSLKGEISTEVAVIGGGLAGVLIAYLLQQRGVPVVILECRKAGGGITKNTTAKITSQHSLVYKKLLSYKGEQKAWEYAMANQLAIEKYQEIIKELQIDCDYEVLPNYIYTLDDEQKIRQEVDAALKLGLPASFTRETTLPFKVKAAIKFDNQAQFHPLKFLDRIAATLKIYENTRVTQINKNGLIMTESEHNSSFKGSVRAKKVVVATHYPFINVPGYYFIRLHQERSYLSALEGCGKAKDNLDGMYLDENQNGFTFRKYKDYLILGGGYHRTGQYQPINSYGRIENAARKWYPNASIKYTWSAQDCMTPDAIPYIGRYSVRTPNIYVATGFNKWGMTSSMVSAMIISDMITGKENEYRQVFTPRRLMLSGSRVFLKDAAIITVSLLAEHLKIPHDKLKNIEKGKAGVVRHDGQRVGVYRDNDDKYYFVTTKCPHLGCKLEWNQNEMTWDCPCHGSRFDYHGKMIDNPAMRDAFDSCKLKKKKLR